LNRFFNYEKFNLLEPEVKQHFKRRAFILIASLLLPLFLFVFVRQYLAGVVSLFFIAGFIGQSFRDLQSIYDGKIYPIEGVCVKVFQNGPAKQLEHKVMRSNALFGKTTIFVQFDSDSSVCEILVPYNGLYEKGTPVRVWTDGNGFFRNGFYVLHAPLLVIPRPIRK